MSSEISQAENAQHLRYILKYRFCIHGGTGTKNSIQQSKKVKSNIAI